MRNGFFFFITFNQKYPLINSFKDSSNWGGNEEINSSFEYYLICLDHPAFIDQLCHCRTIEWRTKHLPVIIQRQVLPP
jgi:hypothetical protein